MFGLVVRFTCKDRSSAEAFDRLVAETVEKIRSNEPGTLVYAVNRVDADPLQRVIYELYRDRAAFDAHEEQDHTKKLLNAREQYLSATEGDWLTLLSGKGTAGRVPSIKRPWVARAPRRGVGAGCHSLS